METHDVRSLACPAPVLELRRLLDEGAPAVRLRVADELARSNVTRFAASRGASVSVEEPAEGGFLVTVTAGEGPAPAAGEEPTRELPAPAAGTAGPVVVQIASEHMGSGDDELGGLLMRGFVKTLRELSSPPATLLFYNAGVKLCCEGSPLIEDLQGYVDEGVEVLACGTCLNFFGLADELRVGRVTDMLEIVTRLGGAGQVLRP